ncbi:unnamed protein product [Fraxinus pennsylvanica]|uniref:RING-type E3 ubiquitin transferase n=1 Tax=Fraxinus pennsylvanica TaxID=56036 RepID=A0AAD1ZG90_9LAMI|nr:unnamed protein product [Fraxinus pennsylvanica]
MEGRTISSQLQGENLTSLGNGTTLTDISPNDDNRAVSRSFSYDADRRYFHLQRDGLVSKIEKFSDQWDGVEPAEDLKLGSEFSEKTLATKVEMMPLYIKPSSDEDVCPTCLEDYTPENPKITTQCSHHFHLCCIYEWMERSDTCPICGKEMEFSESLNFILDFDKL